MKLYLASKFALKEKVEMLASVLKAEGHEITVEWWLKDWKQSGASDEEWYEEPSTKSISERNFNGIRKADACILVCPDDGPTKFNGANVEIGFALALGKRCYSVGSLDRSAMYLNVIRCRDIDELMKKMKMG